MSQVQNDLKHSSSHQSVSRKSSSGNISGEQNVSRTSSRSKQSFEDEVLSNSDPNLLKNAAAKKEMPPVVPPPSKIVSEIKPDQDTVPKSDSKDIEQVKRSVSIPKVSSEGKIEPAPQFIFGAGDDSLSGQQISGSDKRHHHHHHSNKDSDSSSSKHRRSSEKSSRKSSEKKGRKKHDKSQKSSDAQSFVGTKKISRSAERFKLAADAQSVIVKRKSSKQKQSDKGGKPPAPVGSMPSIAQSQLLLDKMPPIRDPFSKKKIADEVTILSIPDDSPTKPKQTDFNPRQSSGSSSSLSGQQQAKRLPIPIFKGDEHGDGLMPLETLAETTIYETNAFGEEKYDAPVKRTPYRPTADLIQPVAGWLKFQVPLVPKPVDTEYERQASKMFDITRLLHQAKNC